MAWSAGHREPSEAARRKAAAFCLDALDECNSDRERQACFAAASQALEADVRPVARPAVTPVRVLSADPLRYQTGFGITVVAGPEFLVTEVSCGCQQRFYLDLHSLITQAAAPRRAVRASAAGCTSRPCRQICPGVSGSAC